MDGFDGHSTTEAPNEVADVLVVGSGIAGLLTAREAALNGCRVTVLSKSPDPRSSQADAQHESSTWDGYVNRYITITEGHPYLDLPGYVNRMYPEIGEDFRTCISQGGILALPMHEWSKDNQRFLKERQRANVDKQATLRLFSEYTDENRASMEMWYELLISAMTQPGLARRVSLHSHGIDRFYDDVTLHEASVQTHKAQNILKRQYTTTEILKSQDFQQYHRGLENSGFIEGGALTMYGLAFDVQALCIEWLFKDLERYHVKMYFGEQYEVVEIERNELGQVRGLYTQSGRRFEARNIAMHPGAYCSNKVLEGTAAEGRLAGVKGYWMCIRNAQDLFGDEPPRPNKIHGGKYNVYIGNKCYKGQISDLNIMPKYSKDGSWELVIGGGYLFVGMYPFEGELDVDGWPAGNVRAVSLAEQLCIRAFVHIVSQVYDIEIDIDAVLSGKDNRIYIPAKGCVRSWTPDDKELRVFIPTVSGGVCFIDGGGNTGSTTKAPFISRAYVQLLKRLDRSNDELINNVNELYDNIRASLCKARDDMPLCKWQRLEQSLNQAIADARL